MNARLSSWNMVYLALMLVGIAMAAYHASSDRWGNAIIAAGAALLGAAVILTGQVAQAAPTSTIRTKPSRTQQVRARWNASNGDGTVRERWLTGAILSGFVATLVMAIGMLFAYMLTGFIGSENGGQLSRWFWALSHNELTDGVWDIPIAALSVNLLAGLAWAVVYGALAEPRLNGPGWWRGLLFALVPWLLSLVVFFPAVGAGFLGLDLDAGPLPALGNLLLHLIYGATLGTVFAIREVSAATGEVDRRATYMENDGIAYGLVIGLTVGIVIGAIVSAIFAPDVKDGVNITLAAGGIGILFGGVIGPFAGLDLGERRKSTETT